MAIFTERVNQKNVKSYQVVIRIKGNPTVTKTFKRLTDAREWASQTETDIKRGLYFKTIEAQKHTLGELIDRYIQYEVPNRKADKVKIILHLNWWKDKIGAYRLSDITPPIISQYKDVLITEEATKAQNGNTNRTKATANRYMGSLSVVLTKASKEWGWMEENPMNKVSKFRESRGRTRFLSKEETKSLLTACKASSEPLLYLFVFSALSTGARWSEINNLKWENVDFNNKMFYFMDTKNGENRGVHISNMLYDLIKEHSKIRKINSSYVFARSDGEKPKDLRWAWERALERSKIKDFRFHDLRHTTASNLAMNGASLLDIKEVLGHKTLNMVQRYSHLTKKHTAKILESMNEKQFEGIINA